jgi:hypothetical protein
VRKEIRLLAITMLVVCLLLLTSCERELSGAKAATVLSLSEPIIDNLFIGLVGNDYATFSRDFDTYMQRSIPGSDFAEWKRGLDSQLGNYLSREVHRVAQSDEFYVVEYHAKFEQEEPVVVGVAFHIAEPHSISHLWIESSQQRWAPEPTNEN